MGKYQQVMAAHLLIVEDDEVLAAQIAQQMDHYGHSATIAHDGLAAVQAVGLEAFDAILLDRMLPRADGMSVLQKLRQGKIGTPVLMLTALGQTGQKIEGSRPAPTIMSSSPSIPPSSMLASTR